PPAAHRRRALLAAREVPPDLDQHALQPPERDHARVGARLRPSPPRRHPGEQPGGVAARRQRLPIHHARPRAGADEDPRATVLPLSMRPGDGGGALPHFDRRTHRDNGAPAPPPPPPPPAACPYRRA